MTTYLVGDNVITRKAHACGGDKWTVVRTGADYKIKCDRCGRVVMLNSEQFHKAVKGGSGNPTTK